MKIAVTYENGTVFGHFGHTAKFKIYDVARAVGVLNFMFRTIAFFVSYSIKVAIF